MSGSAWRRLDDALRRLSDDGRTVGFWLRDDDAVEPTAALERLLDISGLSGVPLALAVIPAHAGAPLAARLGTAPNVTVVLHGWAHENHAGPGEKKQEFGAHRPHAAMLAELVRGRCRLEELFGATFYPLFVPPWNRVDGTLVARLPEAGLAALSTFGRERPSVVPVVNSNVDIIDWHGGRGGRAGDVLVDEILGLLDRGSATVGILAHHLVHDAAAWDFIARLLELTADNPACRWRSVRDLVAQARGASPLPSDAL